MSAPERVTHRYGLSDVEYIRADIADRHKAQRDRLVELVRRVPGGPNDIGAGLYEDIQAAIAECEADQ